MTAPSATRMFDVSAPPPPNNTRGGTEPMYSDDEVAAAIEMIVKHGYIGVKCADKREASSVSSRLSRSVMRSPRWTPMFGEARARWVQAVAVEVNGEWWAYGRVQIGRYVDWEGRKPFKVDSAGKRVVNHT